MRGKEDEGVVEKKEDKDGMMRPHNGQPRNAKTWLVFVQVSNKKVINRLF